MFEVKIFTLYPDLYPGPLNIGIYKKAREKKIWNLEVIDIRDYAIDKHGSVDDKPFGGGSGMLLRPDVVAAALDANLKKDETKLETHNQELIKYSGEVMSLQSKSMYGALDDIGKLYGENELVTNKNMTSFNYAFNLNEYQEFKEDKSSLEDRIKEYNRQTETIKKEQKKKFKKKNSL